MANKRKTLTIKKKVDYKKATPNTSEDGPLSRDYLKNYVGKRVFCDGGRPLNGILKWFDNYAFMLETDDGKEIMLFRHNVDSIELV